MGYAAGAAGVPDAEVGELDFPPRVFAVPRIRARAPRPAIVCPECAGAGFFGSAA